MRHQDRAVVTVSKPGWTQRKAFSYRKAGYSQIPAPLMVTHSLGELPFKSHFLYQRLPVTPASAPKPPAQPREGAAPMEMASPAPKRSLTMAMMLWLEGWRLLSSPAIFLSWQCPISESVMSLMCSWGRAKGSEAPGQVKPPVTQLQEAPALPSLTSTKGDAGGRGCQVQHPARGSRVWWRTGCRAKPVGEESWWDQLH